MRIKNGQDYKNFEENEGYPVIGSGGCFAHCSKYLYDGEALLLGRKGTIDRPLYIKGKFWTVDTMFYAVPKRKDVDVKFLYYQSQTIPFDKYSTSTALPSMTQTDLGYHIFCIPPLSEQRAIASYLDERCGLIDKAIATQRRRIELLQELRQNIITRVVTHGINPNVPLKDSGVEWIGKVPSHWKYLRLRFVCKIRNGYTPSKANPAFWTNGTIPWYRMEDIRENGHILKDAKQYITKEAVKGDGLFEAGSFILATTATIGEHAMLIVDSLANQQFTNLKICKSLKNFVSQKFFYYYLFLIDEYCKSTTRTATFPAVNMEDLKNFFVLIPTLGEQKEIVEFIEKHISRIQNSLSIADKQISFLQELKQSIITEAVTGKIKVC